MDALSPIDVKTTEFLPPFATIERWTTLTTMSRRATFVHIAKGHIVAHKVGRRTLVDVAASMAWIRSQPAPKIRLPTPRFASIDGWVAMSGMSRRNTYEHLLKGDLFARKVGAQTLIDAAAGMAWIQSRPAPKLGRNRRRSQDTPHPARRVLRDWSPDELTRLRALYAQTKPRLSEAEIGRAIGRSKGSVQGKVWRLKLSRPSLRAQALSLTENRERGPPAVAQAA